MDWFERFVCFVHYPNHEALALAIYTENTISSCRLCWSRSIIFLSRWQPGPSSFLPKTIHSECKIKYQPIIFFSPNFGDSQVQLCCIYFV